MTSQSMLHSVRCNVQYCVSVHGEVVNWTVHATPWTPKCMLHQCTLNSAPVCKVSWCKVHNSSHSFIRGQKLSPVIAHPSLKASRDKKPSRSKYISAVSDLCLYRIYMVCGFGPSSSRHTKKFQKAEKQCWEMFKYSKEAKTVLGTFKTMC